MSPGVVPLAAHEEPLLRDFERFHAALPVPEGCFYMFFTTGLLHWVHRALTFVPPWVDLVLVGSDLTDDEDRWIRDRVERPFHHIRRPVDDKTVWELLFAASDRHFGWLDVDCFVLNPELFREMRSISGEDLANCTWAFRGPDGRAILRTYFLFLNADVMDDVTGRIPVSPSVYSFEPSERGRMAPESTTRLVDPRLEEVLRSMLPGADRGRPPYLSERDFYDTLQVYQLVAESLGFRLRRIRTLGHRNSDELVHVGKVSYYNWAWEGHTQPARQRTYRVIAQADFLVLGQIYEQLPRRYADRWRHLRDELPRLGLPTDVAQLQEIMARVLESGGVSADGARRILGAG